MTALIKVVWEIPCYQKPGTVSVIPDSRAVCRNRELRILSLVCAEFHIVDRAPLYILLASTFTSSCTDAALLCSFAVSSSVSLIS